MRKVEAHRDSLCGTKPKIIFAMIAMTVSMADYRLALSACRLPPHSLPQRARFTHDGETHRAEQLRRNDGGDGAFERQRRRIRRH